MNELREVKDMLPSVLYALLEEDPPPEELRLTLGARATLKKRGETVCTPILCTEDLMKETLLGMTKRSYYSCEQTVNEGYVSLPGGLRAGVCGTAKTDRTGVTAVKDVTTIVLRIPRRVPGVAQPILERMRRNGFSSGALLYAPPGQGKTTVLREAAFSLAKQYGKTVALIDQRGEFAARLPATEGLMLYRFYPKAEAISMALRTTAPEVVVADEIGPEDSAPLLRCGFGGVPLLASAHAASIEELRAKPGIVELRKAGLFPLLIGLRRRNDEVYYDFFEERRGSSL